MKNFVWTIAPAVLLYCGAAAAQPQPEAPSGWTEKHAVFAAHEMVAAANPLAAQAGLEILHRGGSALDAAIAVQMVLGLVEPQSSGLGGGAFLLYWSGAERRLRSYDGRESAPQAARPDRFLDANGQPLQFYDAVTSGKSVGVPGVLRMLELAHRRHGRLPWARLFEPAIRLAERGFEVSPRLHRLLERDRFLRRDANARALYYRADGHALAQGARLVNRAYAATLRAIAERGADALYSGPLAEDIVRAVRARGGDLAVSDLAAYAALERDPVCGAYRRVRICGMGPPSSGGVTLLELLGILQRTAFERAPPLSAPAVHYFSEASRLAYADRARYIADPAFVRVPVKGLLDPAYLAQRARLIGERSMGVARPGEPALAPLAADVPDSERHGTSHVAIVDRRGDALAMTTTIENAFGARIMVRGLLLNNELTDFSFEPQAQGLPAANRVEPGKRPRSTMAPTLVFERDGGLRMLLGSPGGAAIVDYVAKTLVAALDWGFDIQAAIAAPNFGSTNGPTLLERDSKVQDLDRALAERGHVLDFARLTSGVQGIERVPGGWRGGADPRREGVALGD
ncbi:MAG TPA: gamma-glutamyltransferase [Burkholderiales bacterium]|nr:gamma-glutamyltransferase [Burkholderiales bacterium]